MAPFQAVYGRLPPSIIPYPSGSTKVAVVEELVMERDALLPQLKQSLAQAKNQMVMQANGKHRDVEYKTGDMVLVKLQPYRQVTLAKRCSNKLAKRYYGPFEVLERIGKGVVTKLPEEEYEGHPVEQPLAICDSRVVLHQGLPTRQVLVQWTGSLPEEATWEWLSEFQEAYPSYHLEDNVISEGEKNVTPRNCRVGGQAKHNNGASTHNNGASTNGSGGGSKCMFGKITVAGIGDGAVDGDGDGDYEKR
ncbi:hypothetical protein Tco_0169538 [Tanacetum coccineum]